MIDSPADTLVTPDDLHKMAQLLFGFVFASCSLLSIIIHVETYHSI